MGGTGGAATATVSPSTTPTAILSTGSGSTGVVEATVVVVTSVVGTSVVVVVTSVVGTSVVVAGASVVVVEVSAGGSSASTLGATPTTVSADTAVIEAAIRPAVQLRAPNMLPAYESPIGTVTPKLKEIRGIRSRTGKSDHPDTTFRVWSTTECANGLVPKNSSPVEYDRHMDFAWSPEQIELRQQARQVATDAVARYGRSNDSWINGFSKEFAREMAALGWIGLTWPTEFGGQGRPPVDRLIIGEELINAGAPIAAIWFADRQMGPTLITYGREDQQAEFLPGMLSGETTWCIGMSEPNAGSDLAALVTSARREGDEWVINGQKIWTSFGAVADYIYLICRTSSDGPPHQGISEIIVPMDTPGIEVRPIKDMTTNQHFCEVFFTDVRVPIENLVGVEGNAFKQTMRQLEHERGGIDRLVSNRALFEIARERADTSDPLIRQEIAALESGYRIGRILVTREVLGQAPKGFSAATKCFCTEHEIRVAEFVGRVYAADAMLWDDVVHGVLYAPGYTIMGGTSNVMRNILGERVLGLPREPRA